MLNRRDFIHEGAGLAAATTWPNALGASVKVPPTDDVALLGEVLRTLHPGLYRYQSPQTLELSLGRLSLAWAQNADLAARYLNLSRFLATIKCGHS